MTRRGLLLVARVAVAGCLGVLASGVTTASGDTAGPPVSINAPEVRGLPGVGKTLRVTNGTWSTSATFTYQWQRCGADPATCTDIPGATAASYRAVLADVGHDLFATVTATNEAGSTSVRSSGEGPVEARRPGVKRKPGIKGATRLGETVSAKDARWTRSPYQFAQQWLRCSATGHACARITGTRKLCFPDGTCLRTKIGTDPAYRLTKRDLGHRLRVRAIAWNGAGRATSTSAPTRIVTR